MASLGDHTDRRQEQARPLSDQLGGDGVDAEWNDELPLPSAELPLPKRRLWPILLVLVALVGGASVLVWKQLTAPLPLRVLVAVDMDGNWWEGSKAAAQIADELGELLTEMGFEPVRAGDPETAAILENAASPQQAARELRAAFIITGRIKPQIEELPVEGGFFEVHVDSQLQLQHLDGSVTEAATHTFAGASSRDEAMGFAADSVARLALDLALPAMLEHESVAAIVKGSDAKLIDSLTPAITFAGARNSELAKAEGAYADLEASRLAEEQGPEKPTFHSGRSADDRLLAVGPDGMLVSTAPVWPLYSPTALEVLRNTGLETVTWRAMDDRAASGHSNGKPLWRGYNAFTYPSASRGQRPTVVMVEDLWGWARALTQLTPGAKPHRLRVTSERKLSEPRVSPDGQLVAFVDRACRNCPKEIAVMDMVSRKDIWRLDAAAATGIGDFAWLDDTRLMAVFRPTQTRGSDHAGQALWGIDVRDGRRFTLLETSGSATLEQPAASRDAKTVVAVHRQARAIVSLDVDRLEVRTHDVDGGARAPSFSHDGKRVVFERTTDHGPYPDIAVLELDSSVVTAVTRNGSPDRYPLFSSDGKRIVFEARNTDPAFGRKRAVVRIASVPAP